MLFFVKIIKGSKTIHKIIATLLRVKNNAIVPRISDPRIKYFVAFFCFTNWTIKIVIDKTKKPAKTFGCENVPYGLKINSPLREALAMPGVSPVNFLSPKK